jgi:hypothetical protein
MLTRILLRLTVAMVMLLCLLAAASLAFADPSPNFGHCQKPFAQGILTID